MEKTLIILKPDAVQRQILGEIITRFEKAGLKIIAVKMIEPDKDQYYHHYEENHRFRRRSHARPVN